MKTKHVCIWRELPGFEDNPAGTCVYCVIDAERTAARREREGLPAHRIPSTNHCEILTERAAREFRQQIALGIEPRFDSEGLVPVAMPQRSGTTRRRREVNP